MLCCSRTASSATLALNAGVCLFRVCFMAPVPSRQGAGSKYHLTRRSEIRGPLQLRLPELVGTPLSINALREDLQLNHKTVARWLQIFENIYAIFRVPPFGAARLRAVKKAQKHYHFDWSVVPELPQRFENAVASHLLKWVHYLQDVEGRD